MLLLCKDTPQNLPKIEDVLGWRCVIFCYHRQIFINPFENSEISKAHFSLIVLCSKLMENIYVHIFIYWSYEFGDYIRHIAKVGSQQVFKTFASLCHHLTSLRLC